jgi:hypothetical protein
LFSIAGIDLEEKAPDQYIFKYPVQENYHVNKFNAYDLIGFCLF